MLYRRSIFCYGLSQFISLVNQGTGNLIVHPISLCIFCDLLFLMQVWRMSQQWWSCWWHLSRKSSLPSSSIFQCWTAWTLGFTRRGRCCRIIFWQLWQKGDTRQMTSTIWTESSPTSGWKSNHNLCSFFRKSTDTANTVAVVSVFCERERCAIVMDSS